MNNPTKATTGESGECHCLIVDDEAFVRSIVSHQLEKLGVRDIQTASSGTEALTSIKSRGVRPDLLFCDLKMPGMDGIEFLRHLSELEFDGEIILFTGVNKQVLNTAEQLAKAHGLNVLGALSKPIKIDDLQDLLQRHTLIAPQSSPKVSISVSVEELKEAIETDQIIPHFQPKVSVKTHELIGVEALARWQHPDKGLIMPWAFIDLAEENDLIDDLTDVMIKKAMEQGDKWLAEDFQLKVSINLSVSNLYRLDMPEFFAQTLSRTGMSTDNIIIEVTESRLMTDITKPLEILLRLNLMGFGLSIDDFGTGASSLEQLKRIPFSELKIDRAFVHGASRDENARAILESSVDLAKKMGLDIIAEGVEDQDDWDLVESLNIDMVQGYFLAKPMPGKDVRPWYESYKADSG